MNESIIIYCLEDSDGIKYIGKTNNLNQRLYRHIFDATNKTKLNKRDAWIKSLLNNESKPKIDVIDVVPINEWSFWEQYWISQFRTWGFNLKNMTNGGEGNYGRVVSENTKIKMSNTKKGKVPKNFNQIIKKAIKGSVKQYSLNGEFIKEWESVNLIKTELKLDNVDLVVKRKRPSAGGFIWRYSYDSLSLEEIKIISDKHKKQTPKSILQFDKNNHLIKEWLSVNDVKKIYKHINAVLRGDRKSAGGYLWKYKEM